MSPPGAGLGVWSQLQGADGSRRPRVTKSDAFSKLRNSRHAASSYLNLKRDRTLSRGGGVAVAAERRSLSAALPRHCCRGRRARQPYVCPVPPRPHPRHTHMSYTAVVSKQFASSFPPCRHFGDVPAWPAWPAWAACAGRAGSPLPLGPLPRCPPPCRPERCVALRHPLLALSLSHSTLRHASSPQCRRGRPQRGYCVQQGRVYTGSAT